MEVVRIICKEKGAWGQLFSSSCAAVLRPEQRVTLPGQAEATGYQGGDATPSTSAFVDWKDKIYTRQDMQDGLYEALRALFPDLPPLVLIALAELMSYVCTACVRGRFWRGQTKWYASDNRNTVGWIRDRYAQHPIAQFLLRVLGIAESIWGFDSYSIYIRTYHNLIPDDLTREGWEEAQRQSDADQ